MINRASKHRVVLLYCVTSIILLFSCSTKHQSQVNDTESTSIVKNEDTDVSYKKPDGFNFVFSAQMGLVSDSDVSKKIFYRIFINSNEVGRTETGKGEDVVSFKAMLEANKDMEMRIEKYILDDVKGRYIKLKNIDQPKPDKLKFSIPSDRILIVTLMEDGSAGKCRFSVEFAK